MSQIVTKNPGLAKPREGSVWRPTEILILGLVMLILASLLPPVPGAVIIALLMTMASRCHGLSRELTWRGWWRRYYRTCVIPSCFSLCGALSIAVSLRYKPPGGPAVGIVFSDPVLAAEVLLRSLAGVAALGYLVITLSIGGIIEGLRQVGLPVVLVELIASMARFGNVLIDTAGKIRVSQVSRSGYKSASSARRSVSLLTTTLFVAAIERARRLEIGLAARAGEVGMLTATHQTQTTPDAVVSPFRLAAIAGLALAVTLLSFTLEMEYRR